MPSFLSRICKNLNFKIWVLKGRLLREGVGEGWVGRRRDSGVKGLRGSGGAKVEKWLWVEVGKVGGRLNL